MLLESRVGILFSKKLKEMEMLEWVDLNFSASLFRLFCMVVFFFFWVLFDCYENGAYCSCVLRMGL